MHLLKIVLLYLLDHVVKVKSSNFSADNLLTTRNVFMDKSNWKIKEDTIAEAFKIMNFHRNNMKEFLYHKFLLSSLMSREEGNSTNKFMQPKRKRIGDQIHNAELNGYKSWLFGSKKSKPKEGIHFQNFTSYLPTAVNKVETNEEDNVLSTETAFSPDHGNTMLLRNYTYPPTVYRNKQSKIIFDGVNPKEMLEQKFYPSTVNNLSDDQLKVFGAILLKNRYLSNRVMGEQRENNFEYGNINDDYTVNLPSVDYGLPIYITNMSNGNRIIDITTEAPVTATYTDYFYNYMDIQSSTSANKPTNPTDQVDLMQMPNAFNQMVPDFSSANHITMPVNSEPYMMNLMLNAMNASYGFPGQTNLMGQPSAAGSMTFPPNSGSYMMNPSYGLQSQMSSMNRLSAGNSMMPPSLVNLMNTMAPARPPVYSSSGPEFSHSFESTSTTSEDNMPYYIAKKNTRCDCEDNNSDKNLSESDSNETSFTDSDIYDAILTTIAFMAFGTYFINMMMNNNEKIPDATLMVVENETNTKNGRKFVNLNDDLYLNKLLEEVMVLIDEFRELMQEQ